ncbi:MAG TPA: alpha/beta hydrolase [Dehalococcoidales bacterium]
MDLWWQGWLPDKEVRAVLLIAHGIAEHSSRYNEVANYFAAQGLAVYGFDYRGHGKSPGERCNVEKFSHFVKDFGAFLAMVCGKQPGKKLFIFGHSMGAVVGLSHVLAAPAKSSGIIISGVPITILPHVPLAVVALLQPLAVVTPRQGIYRLNAATLSRDPAVVKTYDNDPLIYRGKLPARITLGLIWAVRSLDKKLPAIKQPILILHGREDHLSAPQGAQIVFDKIGSQDKTLKYYDGFYHEILNEPGHEQVLEDMEEWLNRRI